MTHTLNTDSFRLEANRRLIADVAGYYNQKLEDIEMYSLQNYPALASMAERHLQHWKNELHKLIFNGMKCYDSEVA